MGGVGVAVCGSVSISLASASLFLFCSGVWLELWNLMGLNGFQGDGVSFPGGFCSGVINVGAASGYP